MQNNYPFKALSKNKKELVVFTLEDGICPLDDNFFFLVRRPGTPILRYDSVMVGTDLNGVFEGDIVEYNEKEHIVAFNRGFALKELNGNEVIHLDKISNYKVVDNVCFRPELKREFSPISFKHVDKEYAKLSRSKKEIDIKWGIKSFYGAIGERLIVNIYGVKLLVPNDEIQQFAGFYVNYKEEDKEISSKIYFSDKIENSPIYMEKGRVCVKYDGIKYDLRRSNILRKEVALC